MASQKQIDANRRNARKSHGPITPEGKAAVRLNALRHGLTARDLVISGEEKPHFEQLQAEFFAEHQPVGPTEEHLVHQMVVAVWRIGRIRAMETGLFEVRRTDLADTIKEDYRRLDPRAHNAYVFLSDAMGANAFATLSRYEARNDRSFYKALHELQRLQARRAGKNVPPPPALDANVTVEHDGGSPAEGLLAASPQSVDPPPLATPNEFDRTIPIPAPPAANDAQRLPCATPKSQERLTHPAHSPGLTVLTPPVRRLEHVYTDRHNVRNRAVDGIGRGSYAGPQKAQRISGLRGPDRRQL